MLSRNKRCSTDSYDFLKEDLYYFYKRVLKGDFSVALRPLYL